MLYGKIYLDKNESGKDTLNFVSLLSSVENKLTQSKVEFIAISPEAKTAFINMLNSDNKYLSQLFGDFELLGDGGFGHGYFTFKETKIENGLKYKTLTEGDLLRIKIINGYSRKVFDYMVPCDNETLKTLNLTENIDENLIWQKYYDNLSNNNANIGNDVETIKKTPPNFLTNTQKEVIKSEYISRFNEFDVYHRNNNANEVDDIIINELAVTFLKSHAVIKSIITQLKTLK